MKTVQEVSRLAHVSVRTLHYYDSIGLLKPTQISEAGYRMYDAEALAKLQLILLFRELKFPLREISEIVNGTDEQRNRALEEQIKLLKKQQAHTENLITLAQGILLRGTKNLDLESVVDWMIMTELSNNTDCAWRRSTYFTKNPGEKLVMGPVWDFDLAFGNFSKDMAGFDTWVSTSEDDYVGVTWSTYLLEDPEFQALFKKRWEEKRSELLEIATEEIWENYHLLSRSADENFQRWQILGKKVAFERFDTKDYPTYFSQMVYLENFLIDRAAWIDSQVEAW